MRILVTGAAGFIGSHLCERMHALGHEVSGLDCFSNYYLPELKELNARALRGKGIPLERADLAADPLDAAVAGVEVVFHLAGQPGIASHVPLDAYVRNNITATHRLLEAVRAAGGLRMFVNISTSSVYGAHATDTEDTPPKPTSYYGVTKLAAEQLALAYQRDKGLPACSLRLFSVYGERERPEKLYPKLIHAILAGKPFPLFEGSEEHRRSYTYVGDILDGMDALLGHLDAANGEIFNIGTDQEMTTGRGIAIVEEILGKKAVIDRKPRRPGDQLRTHADITKARRVLGYNPVATAEEGLRAEVNWYREEIYGKVNVY
jgi:UDP-glucuronate 4-epimerase